MAIMLFRFLLEINKNEINEIKIAKPPKDLTIVKTINH